MKHIVLIVCSLFFLAGCKTKMVYVPVEKVKTEYVNKYLRDSIYHYDSIFIREKGDNILIEKYKYIYRDRLKTDTVIKTDSVQVPYPVTEYKEVNRLSGWQNFQLYAFRILFALILAYFSIRYRKVIFGFFKNLLDYNFLFFS